MYASCLNLVLLQTLNLSTSLLGGSYRATAVARQVHPFVTATGPNGVTNPHLLSRDKRAGMITTAVERHQRFQLWFS